MGITVNIDGTTLLFLNAHLAGMSTIMNDTGIAKSNFPQPTKERSIID